MSPYITHFFFETLSHFFPFFHSRSLKKQIPTKMADEYDENEFEEDFQDVDEPDDLNEDLDAADGEQEQVDILPAGIEYKVQIAFGF